MITTIEKDLPGERWKNIPGFVGYYQVSNFGRVKGIERTVKQRNGVYLKIRKRILATQLSTRGHVTVNLRRPGVHKVVVVYQLMMQSFYGPTPKGYEICHLDGDKLNNDLSNLVYRTRSEIRQLTVNRLRLNCKAVRRSDGREFISAAAASRELGVPAYNVARSISRGQRCRGFRFEYIEEVSCP